MNEGNESSKHQDFSVSILNLMFMTGVFSMSNFFGLYIVKTRMQISYKWLSY
jgi:hypothetical protein